MKFSFNPRNIWLLFVGIFLFSNASFATSTKLLKNPRVKDFIHHMHNKHGFSYSYLDNIFRHAHMEEIVINSMNHPYEARPWYDYRNLFITPERIHGGVQFWKQHQTVLKQAEQKYGVPANIIVAILGIESKYGKEMGNHAVVDALTTFAFGYPERSRFFTKELGQYLIMTRNMHLDPLKLKGSYAGAMGMCQFMPSSYLAYAVNYSAYKNNSKKASPNLFNSSDDAIFSVANYFKQHGWNSNAPITTPALVTGEKYHRFIKKDSRKIGQPKLSLAYLKKFGIKAAGDLHSTDKAYLMQLKGRTGNQYWLAFNNYYVITRYNNSDLYAMAVYQLAQEITAAKQEADHKA